MALAPLATLDAQSARQLLERMAQAEQANRRAAASFVYRERIHYTEQRADGRLLVEHTSIHEVSMLAGEPYHRLVEVNGEPLSSEAEKDEQRRFREVEHYRRTTPLAERRRRYFAAEGQRFRIDTQLVLDYHEMRLMGEETVQGAAVYVVETWPRQDAPQPRQRSQWSLAQRLRYWISQRSGLAVRVEAEQTRPLDISMQGARTRVTYTEVDGVSLLERIESHGRRGRGPRSVLVETEQTYSDYRRFQSESVIVFEDEPAPPMF